MADFVQEKDGEDSGLEYSDSGTENAGDDHRRGSAAGDADANHPVSIKLRRDKAEKKPELTDNEIIDIGMR